MNRKQRIIAELEVQRDLEGHVPLVWREAMDKAISIVERVLSERPTWDEARHALNHYKPESCTGTPRDRRVNGMRNAMQSFMGESEGGV